MIKNPVTVRRRQIEREISKIHEESRKKSRRNYKTDEAFLTWQQRQARKLSELSSELAILDYPEEYYEVPLAIAATEIGLTLNEIVETVREGLIELAFEGEYIAGSRITRDELARAIEVGASSLLEVARQIPSEIFNAVCPQVERGDVELLQKAYDRIDRNDSCLNPFALALEIGIQFLSGDLHALKQSIDFLSRWSSDDLAATLIALKAVAERLPRKSHPMEVIRERILATANGKKEIPFRDTFARYGGAMRRSQMRENQRRALYMANVIVQAIGRYKFIKSLESPRSYMTDRRQKEMERVISNAVYTALEAESSYNESAASKLFVDKYVELSPKWSKPPEAIEL
ncbi:MAG: hypothetical protein JNL64_13895 [Blastocatellia bacterium]|nr:hypothetical protein [Blastocatellia bacterium]